jgi:hypothetical protein
MANPTKEKIMNDDVHEEANLPQNKEELLARIDEEWKLLEAVISGIGADRMLTPKFGGWSVKDILAHITAWERFMCLNYLQHEAAHEAFGLSPKEFESLEEDGFNAIIYERNRDRVLKDVRSDFYSYHEQATRSIRELPFETMLEERLPGDPAGEPLLVGIAANTYDHYREHRESIEELM